MGRKLMLRADRDETASQLRLEMSQTEWRLWYWLRDRQLDGHKFRRQVPIGPYYADFACLARRLVVEVDGDHHATQKDYDARRDAWLRARGYRVLRFWANDVDENLEAIVEAIKEALRAAIDGPPT